MAKILFFEGGGSATASRHGCMDYEYWCGTAAFEVGCCESLKALSFQHCHPLDISLCTVTKYLLILDYMTSCFECLLLLLSVWWYVVDWCNKGQSLNTCTIHFLMWHILQNMYDMLMLMLEERGINHRLFADELQEFSTQYENEQYIKLLESLKGFLKAWTSNL